MFFSMFYTVFYLKNERIAHFLAHQKWAMWANRSGRSPNMSTAKLYTHKIKCQTSFVHLYLNCRILFTLTLYEQNHTYYLLYNIDKRINNYNNNTRQETSTFTIVRDRTHPLLLAFLVFWSAEREIFSKTYGSKKFICCIELI